MSHHTSTDSNYLDNSIDTHNDNYLYETIVYSITIPVLILTTMGNYTFLLVFGHFKLLIFGMF